MPCERGGADRIVGLEEMPHHADAQPLHALAEIGGEVGHRTIGARRIGRIVAGHRLQQQRAVLHRPGQRPGVVQRERQRQHAGAADQAVGGLDAGDAAQRRGPADRAAGVRAGAAEDHAGRDRRAGAGRGAGGEVLRVPGIARRRPGQVERRAAHGELMRRQLAHHHRAGLGPFAHHGGVAFRHVVLEQPGMPGRADAGGVVDVLVADRDAVERAARQPRHDARLGRACVGHGAFLRRQDEGVQRVVQLLDAVEAGLGQFDRRKLLRRDLPRRFGDGQERVHHRTSGMKMCAGSAASGIGLFTRAIMPSSIQIGIVQRALLLRAERQAGLRHHDVEFRFTDAGLHADTSLVAWVGKFGTAAARSGPSRRFGDTASGISPRVQVSVA